MLARTRHLSLGRSDAQPIFGHTDHSEVTHMRGLTGKSVGSRAYGKQLNSRAQRVRLLEFPVQATRNEVTSDMHHVCS